MNRFFILLSFLVVFAGCQKEEMSTESFAPETPATQSSAVSDYIVLFKEQNFSGLNSLVTSLNYEASFDVFQYEYDKILAQAGVKAEQTLQTYIKVANGCAVSMKHEDYLKLKSNPNVKGIIKDTVFTLNSTSFSSSCAVGGQEIIPCGVEMIGGGKAYTGKSRAFVLDSGVEFDHPDLKVSKSLQFSAFKYKNDNKAIDRLGHGTHVSGIIGAKANNGIGVVGVAPGVEIVPVKVIDDNGSGALSGILAGIDFVKAKAMPGDVANMSLGSSAISVLDNAVYDASQSGIWFTIAAGNNGGNALNNSPARANGTYIVTVSAMTCDGNFAFFSNYGTSVVDYIAPGVNICSTVLNGSYGSYSGTSMAAPHAAGVILMTNGKPNSCGNVMCEKDNAYYKAICL